MADRTFYALFPDGNVMEIVMSGTGESLGMTEEGYFIEDIEADKIVSITLAPEGTQAQCYMGFMPR